MKNLIFVVFLLLFTQSAVARSMDERVSKIEASWVNTTEEKASEERENIFLALVNDISDVVIAFPEQAEPLIIKSTILLTMAKDASSFVALGLVNQAKALLDKAIQLNPEARQGSALVTMGVIYYKTPGWPIAFGDDKEAENYLLQALAVNPNGVSSNYYYATFLLDQGDKKQAANYLTKAVNAKLDPNNISFKIKQQQQQEAKLALASLS
jgi:tetratricopeptide (TPR) repeat protein